MRKIKYIYGLMILLLLSASQAFSAVQLDLVNPSTGNPADQDTIVSSPGSTVTLRIRLTSNGNSVVGTANDISYNTDAFTNPQATIGTVASDAGKTLNTSTPSSGVFRVGIVGFNTNVIADGVVAIITFDVKSTAASGSYTLTNGPDSTDFLGAPLSTTGSNATVIVNNAPSVNAGADQTANEGATVSLAPATLTDVDVADTHTATINWGDGTSVATGAVSESGGSGTVSGNHVYADNGTYTVTVTVTDNAGVSASDALIVTVSNVAAVVNAGTDQTKSEGATVSLSGSFTDAGTADTHTATINWGDGTSVATGAVSESGGSGTVSGSHVYADNGIYTVTLTVTDDDSGAGSDTLIVTVSNAAPVVNSGVDQTKSEGATVSLSGSFTDAGTADTHTATINWGDGTSVATGAVSESGGSGTVSGSHVYADNGSYTVTLTVTDDDGGAGTDTLIVTVSNVAPVVNAGVDQTKSEGATVSLSGSFTDAGTADTHTATINWGDGTSVTTGAVSESGGSGTVSGSHVYADNGTYTVTVTVTDDDGGAGTDTLIVTVSNAAPVVNAGADKTANEGATVSLSGSFTDAGTADTHTATINWGDGTSVTTGTVSESAGSGTVSGSHVYADNGTYTVTVTVTDDDGGAGSDTLIVTVSNVAPVVNAGADKTANEGATVSVSGSFTDAGSADTHTATINWGDATSVTTGAVSESGGSGTVSGSHVYADNGTYTVTITVTDNAGGSGSDTLIVTVSNVAPSVSAGPDMVVDLNETITLDQVFFTDAGSGDTHTATINWGDSTTDTGVVTESGGSGTVSGSHTYTTAGTFTVTVTVSDDDGGQGSDTLTVTLKVKLNLANPLTGNPADQDPVVVVPGGTVTLHIPLVSNGYSVGGTSNDISYDTNIFTNPAATAGQVATNAGKFVVSSTPSTGIFRVGITGFNQNVIADGVVAIVTFNVNSSTGAGDHTMTNVASSADPPGVDLPTTGSDAIVIIGNAPSANAGLDRSANEGATVSLSSAAFTDADVEDTHTATIDWGDGTSVATGTVAESGGSGTVSGSHVYADNGIYTATVTVTDEFGASGSDTLIVTVSNVAPVVNAGADKTASEGATVSLSGSFTDAGTADTHTATINWGDGTSVTTGTVTESGGSGTVSASHVYADNGTFTVTLTVTDDDGAAGSDTLIVTVGNVAPTVNAGADRTASEGATVSLESASFTDAGSGDTHTARINWGDGTAVAAGTVTELGGSGTVSGSHVYADNGTYTVTVTVTDDNGGAGNDTFIVTVSNVAPVVNAGADRTANEGATVSLSASFTDAGTGDTHTATINWGDGTALATGTVAESSGSGTVSSSHVYADNGTYTVTLTVTDDDSGVGSDTLIVTVGNAAPTVNAGADKTANEGATVSLSASFTDAGSGDTHTATINWGDARVESGTVNATARTVSGSHIYTNGGTYIITVTVTDDDGAAGSDTATVVVRGTASYSVNDALCDGTASAADYVGIGVPFIPVNQSDTFTVFGASQLGGSAGGATWRLFRYDSGANRFVEITKVGDDTLNYKTGYFLIATRGCSTNTIDFSITGNPAPNLSDSHFTSQPGKWALFSNPFKYNATLSATPPEAVSSIYHWVSGVGRYEIVGKLSPLESYFLFNLSSSEAIVTISAELPSSFTKMSRVSTSKEGAAAKYQPLPPPLGVTGTDPYADVKTDAASYFVGDTLVVSANLYNPGPTRTADVYIWLNDSEGNLYTYDPGERTFTESNAPTFASFDLPGGEALAGFEIVRHLLVKENPLVVGRGLPDNYTISISLTQPGSLDPLGGEISSAAFTVVEGKR